MVTAQATAASPQPLAIPGLVLYPDFVTPVEQADIIEQADRAPWCGRGIAPNPEMHRRTQHYGFVFSYRHRKILSECHEPLPEFLAGVTERVTQLPDWTPRTGPDANLMVLVNEYNPGQGIMPHKDSSAIFGPAIGSLSLLSPCLMTFTKIKPKPMKSKPEADAQAGADMARLSTDSNPTGPLVACGEEVIVDPEVMAKLPDSISVYLPPRSLLLMTGIGRDAYTHTISKDMTERLPPPDSLEIADVAASSLDKPSPPEHPSVNALTLQKAQFERERRISLTFRTVRAVAVDDKMEALPSHRDATTMAYTK
ncbi:hypothetical protein CXG81DRAFT_18873 [Caulochytrium protostelioides]|uniref:Fe2OG dioxygenase domain-containing protein n=1 Tax=Caulochytrium protostelioides TaxID=1555241 RepID=A0A4P9WWE8_9FUNG|nr:hypothetical protein CAUPRSCDRAFT_6181 [Caulochytrium protostelioides]RKP01291.1 hypothetical protein CXG81DRAFT_18873 [Caulochytrium protostelioides]|eukprot:RKP01291.1 hypothetical protein CXG81DRAFT_18873 [Caulochytrium protostelioides]